MKKHYYHDDIISICDNNHYTVEEIFARIVEKYPEAGKSSIYRNVEQLAERGELRKVIGVGKKAYFEKNKGNHAHLIDQQTGTITDIDFSDPIVVPHIPKGFEVEHVDIKIFGSYTQ
ncbi:MAG: transcriptional repressor [Patescibacteria group bacterium]|nr:transcriptional repressor [Patescibacteria group bacterium]